MLMWISSHCLKFRLFKYKLKVLIWLHVKWFFLMLGLLIVLSLHSLSYIVLGCIQETKQIPPICSSLYPLLPGPQVPESPHGVGAVNGWEVVNISL